MTFIKGFIIRARAGRGQCGGLSRHWCQGRSSPAPGPRGAGVLVGAGRPGRGDLGRARSLGAAHTCRQGEGGRVGRGPRGAEGGRGAGVRTSARGVAGDRGDQGAVADIRAEGSCQGSRASEIEESVINCMCMSVLSFHIVNHNWTLFMLPSEKGKF